MKIKIDAKEKKEQEEVEKIVKERASKSSFVRLLEYNNPKYHIFFACFGAAMMGVPQPYLATVLSKLLGLLTIPMDMIENKEIFTSVKFYGVEGSDGLDLFFERANGLVLIFVYIAIITGAGGYIKRFYFGCLGANSTYAIRDLMYKEILKKNMGWFDMRENSSGTLLSAMA